MKSKIIGGQADLDVLSQAVEAAGIDKSKLAAVRGWLSENLMGSEYAKLGQGGHKQNQIPLRNVFVDLPVAETPNSASYEESRTLFLDNLMLAPTLELKEVFSATASQFHAGIAKKTTIQRSDQDSWKAKQQYYNFSASLLIGGPGQGKSTLGQLACQLYRVALLRPFEKEMSSHQRELIKSFEKNEKIDDAGIIVNALKVPDLPHLPIQIALPEFSAWLNKESNLDMPSNAPLILRFLADFPSAKNNGLNANDLFAMAIQIPSLIVLDGFDEVGAPQDRERLVAAALELLTNLSTHNARAKILATTRPQGYAGELAQIGVPLKSYYLTLLSTGEALEYANKLVKAKISSSDLQKRTIEKLTEAAHEDATQRLLTTPLQVTILAALVQQYGRTPKERWNLFHRYFSYTYDREIERENYASNLLQEHRANIEKIHARVALLLQVEAERAGGGAARMSRVRLGEIIDAVLLEEEVSEEDRKDLVIDIAKAAEERLVFLVEPEPGQFGYEIRSLQEFMAAWELTSGRDNDIETRLNQISKAPMFRNVVLFAASRFFSELSPLRDIFADRICWNLDSDQTDEICRLTSAGALLALETLEEGAVLSQPKRARALMTRAIKLLTLPPSSEHMRLARIATTDTEELLSDAIESAISDPLVKKQFVVDSAWLCLIEAINLNYSWAISLGETYLRSHSIFPRILQLFQSFDVSLGTWLASKIESAADKISPNAFVDVRRTAGADASSNWTYWILTVLNGRSYSKYRAKFLHLICVGSRLEDMSAEPSGAPPAPWAPWIEIARFELAPSAERLEIALKTLAEYSSPNDWEGISWRLSWPMATCIKAAESQQDLLRIAKMVSDGILGDKNDWVLAEENWARDFQILSTLETAKDQLLWTVESIQAHPPLLALPIWVITDVRERGDISWASVYQKLNEVFRHTKFKIVREWIATGALLCLRLLPAKFPKSELDVQDWIKEAPDYCEYLVPRPRCMLKSEWNKILDPIVISMEHSWYISPELAFKALSESPIHPFVLHLVARSLQLHQASMFDWDEQAIIKNIQNYRAKSPREFIELQIVQTTLGVLPSERDSELVESLFSESIQDAMVSALINALSSRKLPFHRIEEILSNIYHKIGSDHRYSSRIIVQLRNVFQTRKSDLEKRSVWDRLALPLPHPVASLVKGYGGNVPRSPIVIKSIELKDVRGFQHLQLQFEPPSEGKGQWILLIGQNGVGKTTILRSLALGLRNTKDPSIWPQRTFSDTWQRTCDSGEDKSIDTQITITLGDGNERKTIIRSDRAADIVQIPESEDLKMLPLFAYGCRRGSALGGTAQQLNSPEDSGREIATLFDEGADLIHAETWLIALDGDAQKSDRGKVLYRAVTNALKTLLSLELIEVQGLRVWIQEPGKAKLPFSALSDGYLTSAGWFLDLIARWVTFVERNNETVDETFMLRMCGIVLIDEIDLHLHPQWQLEVVGRARKLFPQMTFVVTTHNPLTLVGAKASEIWNLTNEDGRIVATCGKDDPSLLTGSQIYLRYFEIEDTFPNSLGRKLQRYSYLSGNALRSDQEEKELQDIKQILNDAGIDPGWDVVARKRSYHPDLVPAGALK